eukprot:141163-Prymnesium_polylepis.1
MSSSGGGRAHCAGAARHLVGRVVVGQSRACFSCNSTTLPLTCAHTVTPPTNAHTTSHDRPIAGATQSTPPAA